VGYGLQHTSPLVGVLVLKGFVDVAVESSAQADPFPLGQLVCSEDYDLAPQHQYANRLA